MIKDKKQHACTIYAYHTNCKICSDIINVSAGRKIFNNYLSFYHTNCKMWYDIINVSASRKISNNYLSLSEIRACKKFDVVNCQKLENSLMEENIQKLHEHTNCIICYDIDIVKCHKEKSPQRKNIIFLWKRINVVPW